MTGLKQNMRRIHIVIQVLFSVVTLYLYLLIKDQNNVPSQVLNSDTANKISNINSNTSIQTHHDNHNEHDADFKLTYNGSFYVYDSIDWMSIKCDGDNLTTILQTKWKDFKHADDYWFYKHALEHPLRTNNPDKASIFIVGGLLNLVMERHSYTECCIGSVCHFDLFRQVEDMLLNSTWFKRSKGADHLVVATQFRSTSVLQPYSVIQSCHWISYFDNIQPKAGRLRVAKTYVGHACPPAASKTHDIAFIGSLHPNRTHFQPRRNACNWLMNQTGSKIWTIKTCGEGQQCPTLAEARMGLHISGDTLGSNRLIDTLLSGTVPVLTNKSQYYINAPFFPWKKMTVFAPVNTKTSFFEGIAKAMVSKAAEFNRVHNISTRVDWHNNYLFEQYMAYISIELQKGKH